MWECGGVGVWGECGGVGVSEEVRLFLGDCLEVLPTLAAGSVDAVITDLPYGTTACEWDAVIPFEHMWREVKWVLKPCGAFVTTASQPFTSMLVMSNLEWFRYEWIWEKLAPTGFLQAKRMPLKDHENICVFYDQQSTYDPQGLRPCHIKSSRKNGKTKRGGIYRPVPDGEYYAEIGNYPRSIVKLQRVTHEQIHPTQKPVALYAYLIRTYTNEGDTVLDFCMGAGTTGVACVKTGRRFIGVEIVPEYFEIARRRIGEAQLQGRLPLEEGAAAGEGVQLGMEVGG